MMKRLLSTCCGLTLLAGSSASASSINLSWNDCGVAGTQDAAFLCNTNVGARFAMYASFDPPDGITRLAGGLAVIDIQGAYLSIPPWWHFRNPGTCRENSLTLETRFTSGPFTCQDPWAVAPAGDLGYTIGFCGNPDVARLYVSVSVSEALAGPVAMGNEYYAFRILIDRAKTVGPGACGGCLDDACIVLNHLRLHQPAGLGDYLITSPRDRNFVTWQGGTLPSPGCPLLPQECTPTIRSTWGQIKSLYR